jgi:methylthioribose-1-phosphate isomerase
MIPTVAWHGDAVRILDQTRLPAEETFLDLASLDELCEAILSLRVRGAPAIGICGGYGLALAAQQAAQDADVRRAAAVLRAVRPTAVNLAWAVDRVLRRYEAALAGGAGNRAAAGAALAEARAIHEEDLAASRAMGRWGAELVGHDARILTHCNAGGLATGGLGTALAVVFAAAAAGKRPRVFAAETRPLLQGARLTAWELHREGIDTTVLVDGARAWLMATVGIDLVLVGADRVAANGDAANKIGTLSGAIVARRYGVPFYVVAPSSSFDLELADGGGIPVELRGAQEVWELAGVRTAPQGVDAWNPAFDVTPAELITGWVTEHGVLRPPFTALSSG